MSGSDPDDERELARIRSAYADYARTGQGGRWTLSDPANRSIHEERLRALGGSVVGRMGQGEAAVLDVGCGAGGSLTDWASLGFPKGNLFGVDLLPARIAETPGDLRDRIVCGGAHRLPFADASFDLVSAFTLLSSILSEDMIKAVTTEMRRVIKADGRIVVYDMRTPNPLNRHLCHLSRHRLERLFPGARVESHTLTLLPPLARRLAKSPRVYDRLASLPFLRSHRLSVVSFPPSDAAL